MMNKQKKLIAISVMSYLSFMCCASASPSSISDELNLSSEVSTDIVNNQSSSSFVASNDAIALLKSSKELLDKKIQADIKQEEVRYESANKDLLEIKANSLKYQAVQMFSGNAFSQDVSAQNKNNVNFENKHDTEEASNEIDDTQQHEPQVLTKDSFVPLNETALSNLILKSIVSIDGEKSAWVDLNGDLMPIKKNDKIDDYTVVKINDSSVQFLVGGKIKTKFLKTVVKKVDNHPTSLQQFSKPVSINDLQ